MPMELQSHKAPNQLGISPLDDTLRWFKEAVPQPSTTTLGVQMGVHFEEVTEQLDCIIGHSQVPAWNVLEARRVLKILADDMKANPDSYGVLPEDRLELLDALCDQNVTGAGTAHMLGMDMVGAMNEVNRSNWSKFVDGKAIFTEQGKIAKGPNYSRPDLTPYI